jgi:hypothetical protein
VADIGDDYHALTHRMTEPGVPEQVAKCILWEVEQIGVFLKRLKAMPEGDHNATWPTSPKTATPGNLRNAATLPTAPQA